MLEGLVRIAPKEVDESKRCFRHERRLVAQFDATSLDGLAPGHGSTTFVLGKALIVWEAGVIPRLQRELGVRTTPLRQRSA